LATNAPAQWQEFSYIEYFAGMGNLTRCMKSAQYRSIRLDIKDHSPETKKNNYMDLASAAGMAFPEMYFS
jgi:hypothetical protein